MLSAEMVYSGTAAEDVLVAFCASTDVARAAAKLNVGNFMVNKVKWTVKTKRNSQRRTWSFLSEEERSMKWRAYRCFICNLGAKQFASSRYRSSSRNGSKRWSGTALVTPDYPGCHEKCLRW